MPGLPLAVRETTCSDSRRGDQMCRQQSRVCSMSEEEKLAAEESLSLYCKPVELYNVLNRRFVKKPRFLQRNLLYRIHAKHKKRIQVSVSLSRGLNEEIQSCNIFPLYIILAKPCEGNASRYWLNRAYMLKSFFEFENKDKTEANFVIPDLKRLASDSRVSNLHIIVISTTGQNGENICENEQLSSFPNVGGKCYFGKIPIKLLSSSLENCVTLSLGHKAQMLSKINMQPTYLEPSLLEQNSCISFHPNKEDTSGSFELQVSISAEETGASERTIYDSYTYDNIPSSSLHHIMSLRAGNVLFHYRYYNNTLQRTEVTEDFACPFCYVKCGSFKGLKCHLTACHDLFEFEFLVTEEFQAVCVSLKIDAYKSDLAGQGVDPKLQTFYYRSSYKRRKNSEKTKKFMNQVHADIMQSDPPDETLANNLDQDLLLNENGTTCSSRTLAGQVSMIDTAQTSNLAPPTVLQFGKTRKLSVERADPRNRALLQKRQFFHSHRAQPMAVEQVFSDRDSEDEVDDDIADFEDRRMLDDFVDVTKDEKQIMHLWNSFVRKQRVLADGHIAWACEGFSRLHGKDLVQAPALLWNWRLLMIKLWNHSLLDARTMNNCNLILESFQNDISSPMQT